MKHDLIKTGDSDVTRSITDRNGEVVLSYCRRCKEGEGSLEKECPYFTCTGGCGKVKPYEDACYCDVCHDCSGCSNPLEES